MSGASLIAAGILPKIKFDNSPGILEEILEYFFGNVNKDIQTEKEIYSKLNGNDERENYKIKKQNEIKNLDNTKEKIFKVFCVVGIVFVIFLIIYLASDSKTTFGWLSVISGIIGCGLFLGFLKYKNNIENKKVVLEKVITR